MQKKKTHCNFSSEVIAELVFFPRDHILLCCWFVKNYDAFLEVDMTYVLYSYITASLKCSLSKTFQRKSNSEKRYVSKARGHCTTGIGWFALPTVSQTCSRCWTGRAALWLRFCSLFLCRNFLRATRAWMGLGATGFHLCFCRWYLVASFGGRNFMRWGSLQPSVKQLGWKSAPPNPCPWFLTGKTWLASFRSGVSVCLKCSVSPVLVYKWGKDGVWEWQADQCSRYAGLSWITSQCTLTCDHELHVWKIKNLD